MFPDPFRVSNEGETLQALGYEINLARRRAGDLTLRTGKLVACDPLAAPETEPFERDLPNGTFPVYVTVADLREETRIAYAAVRFSDTEVTSWEIARVHGEEPRGWRDSTEGGFYVDSGVAGFLDGDAGTMLLDIEAYAEDDEEFPKQLHRALTRQRKNGTPVGFADLELDPLTHTNLVAFDADSGTYPTYFGLDGDGEVAIAATDFRILDYRFTRYGLRY